MIYLIHGADSFRAHEKLQELIEAFKKKDPNQMNLDIFDIEETDVKKIKASAQMMGFLSSARMIVIKNLFGKGNIDAKKEIADFVLTVSKQSKSPDFIFFENVEIGKKGSAGGKEWSALAKKAEVFVFEPLDSVKIRQWIINRTKEEKVKISPSSATKLALYVGNDLWRLSHEIDKLVLLTRSTSSRSSLSLRAHPSPFDKLRVTQGDLSKVEVSESKTGQEISDKKSGEPVINDDDIESMVKSDIPTSIFTTIDALARRDKKTALKLLEEHLEKGEEPLYLFSMFVYQFSNLIKVKDMVANQKIGNSDQIASALKMHPFVVKKTMPYAAKFNFEYLKKVYKRLLRFDFMIKKGRLDPEVALEMIVIEVGNLS